MQFSHASHQTVARQDFRRKGVVRVRRDSADVQLVPGIKVERVPRGGRRRRQVVSGGHVIVYLIQVNCACELQCVRIDAVRSAQWLTASFVDMLLQSHQASEVNIVSFKRSSIQIEFQNVFSCRLELRQRLWAIFSSSHTDILIIKYPTCERYICVTKLDINYFNVELILHFLYKDHELSTSY